MSSGNIRIDISRINIVLFLSRKQTQTKVMFELELCLVFIEMIIEE